MWINKNVYKFEKVLAEKRIDDMAKVIDELKAENDHLKRNLSKAKELYGNKPKSAQSIGLFSGTTAEDRASLISGQQAARAQGGFIGVDHTSLLGRSIANPCNLAFG